MNNHSNDMVLPEGSDLIRVTPEFDEHTAPRVVPSYPDSTMSQPELLLARDKRVGRFTTIETRR